MSGSSFRFLRRRKIEPPKIEPIENAENKRLNDFVDTVLSERNPEELRDMALAFVRSSYIRKNGHVQPKLDQNPILAAFHSKHLALQAIEQSDPEFDAIYAKIVEKSRQNFELLKYRMWHVYFQDFNMSKDDCFVTFYTGFRNQALVQLGNAISTANSALPDYKMVTDFVHSIEHAKTKRIEELENDIIAFKTTLFCKSCLVVASHYCCDVGAYCSIPCYQNDADHRACCESDLKEGGVIIGARKNNRKTYKERFQAAKAKKMPTIF